MASWADKVLLFDCRQEFNTFVAKPPHTLITLYKNFTTIVAVAAPLEKKTN